MGYGHVGQSAAFTVVEILIVVMVVAIVTAVALPLMEPGSATRLRWAAQMLIADLEFAKVESITHPDDPRLVEIDSDGGGYHIATVSAPATPIDDPIGGKPYDIRYGSGPASQLTGVTISSHSFGADRQIEFGIYGQHDQDTDVTITLAADDRRLIITLDADTAEPSVGEITKAPG